MRFAFLQQWLRSQATTDRSPALAIPRPEFTGPTALTDHLQHTLRNRISCTGIGLHSGAKVSLTLHPADADTGIVFVRGDLDGERAIVPATWRHVVDTMLCTTIGNDDGVRVATIEHLMAALHGCGIDNAIVEVSGAEVPIMDGSAAPFVFLIECAGLAVQDQPRHVLRIRRKVEVQTAAGRASLAPAKDFSLGFEIEYNNKLIARQRLNVRPLDIFKTDICRARTYGFEHEVEALRARGLARGGSLDNAVVVSGDTVLNKDGLRYRDEFVRHKVLDAMGDLYLAGGLIRGHFEGQRAGHGLNNQLLRALFADPSAWVWEDAGEAAPRRASWEQALAATA